MKWSAGKLILAAVVLAGCTPQPTAPSPSAPSPSPALSANSGSSSSGGSSASTAPVPSVAAEVKSAGEPAAMKSAEGISEERISVEATGVSSAKIDATAIGSEAKESLAPAVDWQGLLEMRLPVEELDQGWIRLFDGQSLFGWESDGKANWRVEDGELVADEGEPGFLMSQVRWSDYELMVEFRATERTNSGIFLRTEAQPTSPAADCIELNIAPSDNPFPTGSLVERVRVEPEALGENPPDQWHTLHVLADGPHMQVWFDGRSVVDTQIEDRTTGRIGLQFREGAVAFRNLRIRPLLLQKLMPDDQWNGWSQEHKGDADFRLEESGQLSIEGGKGQLELLQPFGDFCLQAEVLTENDETNSGIFFRSIPGDVMNGYEMQLHTGFDPDRLHPLDGGMGGIFRRQEARAALSETGQWTHLTLVADGNRFATWVEGVQVTQWQDDRKPHENPRSGLRLEPGTLILQGHDPKCRAKLRKLLAMPIEAVREGQLPEVTPESQPGGSP
ncbi:MAG: DUF1080 domain-containing protein [Pirellulaceae bacterium]